MPWLTASLLGVVTAVFGGLLRDIMINEVPLVFTSELYATAAWAGAMTLIGLEMLGMHVKLAALDCPRRLYRGAHDCHPLEDYPAPLQASRIKKGAS